MPGQRDDRPVPGESRDRADSGFERGDLAGRKIKIIIELIMVEIMINSGAMFVGHDR